MLQILSALEYMHGIGVIHRDLKLGNLLLDKHMGVKIGDLGLAAKLTDAHERKRTLCGTPNYIAPEILENKNGHSFEVDVWSTGVVMYTMLVGRPPYESKDVKATYKRILANDFTFPDHVHLSGAAVDLIKQMLVTNPAQRPSLRHIQDHPFFTRGGHHSPPTSMPVSALITPPSSSSSSLSSAATRTAGTANVESAAPSTANAATSVKTTPLIPHPEVGATKASTRPSSSSGRVVAKHPSEVQQEVLARRAAAAAAANHGAARLTGNGKAGATAGAATPAASTAATAVTPQVDELATAMRLSSSNSSKGGVGVHGGGEDKLLGSSAGSRPVRRSRSSSGLRGGSGGSQQPAPSAATASSTRSSVHKGSASSSAAATAGPTTFNDALNAESDHKKPSGTAAVAAASSSLNAPQLRSSSGRGRSASRTRPAPPSSSSASASSAVQHQPPFTSPGFAATAVVAEPTNHHHHDQRQQHQYPGATPAAALASSANLDGTPTLEKQFAGLAVTSSAASAKGGHNGTAMMEPGSLESIHAQLAATMVSSVRHLLLGIPAGMSLPYQEFIQLAFEHHWTCVFRYMHLARAAFVSIQLICVFLFLRLGDDTFLQAALEAKQGQPSSGSASTVGGKASSAVNAPALWVTQYVDYTSK